MVTNLAPAGSSTLLFDAVPRNVDLADCADFPILGWQL
jgi:hypothetical protein